MTAITGFAAPFVIYSIITLLHLWLPGRRVDGYVKNETTGQLLQYTLNGRRVLIFSLLIWAALGYFNIVPLSWLYTVRFYSMAGAFIIGLGFSLAIVLPYPSTGKSLPVDLFLGRLKNPQTKRIDAKMWLYLVGAVMLELNALSFAAYHHQTFGANASPGVFLSAGLITWFVFDYLTFEEVHLYTYDLFAERVGFKLGWGCLTFYPFFYAIALFDAAGKPSPHTPLPLLVLYAVVFFTGWSLARGANMQKYTFKKDPTASFLGMAPQTVTDGEKTLLVVGFWGVSRHVNYLGEILMAVGIAAAVGHPTSIWPWLYPLYYVALLFPRERDDDKRCAQKYGPLWTEYTTKVKHRIIPFIY